PSTLADLAAELTAYLINRHGPRAGPGRHPTSQCHPVPPALRTAAPIPPTAVCPACQLGIGIEDFSGRPRAAPATAVCPACQIGIGAEDSSQVDRDPDHRPR